MGPLLFGTSFRAAMNLIIKSNSVKSNAMHGGNFQLVNGTFRSSKQTVFAIAAIAISADAAFF